MRRLVLPLVLLAAGFAATAPPAAAQEPTVDLVMEDSFFRLATGGARNPPIPVAAGEEVVVRVTNRGEMEHNFHVGSPVGRETPCCQEPGESATLAFTVPADAPPEIRYWCVLHRAQGMEGVLRVQAAGVPRLTIQHPEEGATVPPQFTVAVRVENATLGTQARLHFLVDAQTGHPGWNTTGSTFTTPPLEQGYHLVRVELVDADGQPREPPVAAERVVFVSSSAPPETTTPTGATPGPGAGGEGEPVGTPAPGAALGLLAVASAAALARRARRP